MPRIMEPPQQFESAHAGKVGIDQKAPLSARAVGLKKFLARRIVLDTSPLGFERAANPLANFAVVVDDENHGGAVMDDRLGRMRSSARMRLRFRRSRSMTCVNSFGFIGLLSCTQP